jgi:maleate isomerase
VASRWLERNAHCVLTPRADVTPESEFNAMTPKGISVHAARVPLVVYRPGGEMDPTIADDPVRRLRRR